MLDYMLEPTKKRPPKVAKNFSLTEEGLENLVTLADLYDANVSSTLDEILTKIVPGIIKAKREE